MKKKQIFLIVTLVAVSITFRMFDMILPAVIVLCIAVWHIAKYSYIGTPLEVEDLVLGTTVEILGKHVVSDSQALYLVLISTDAGHPKISYLRYGKSLSEGDILKVSNMLNGEKVHIHFDTIFQSS